MAYTTLLLEGFDDQTYTLQFAAPANPVLVAGDGGIGTALQSTSNLNAGRFDTGVASPASFTTSHTFGMRIKSTANGVFFSGNETFTSSFPRHITLELSGGLLHLRLANGTSTVTNLVGSFVVPSGWFYLEIQITGSTAATGLIRLFVDNVEVYENAAIRTANSGGNGVMRFHIAVGEVDLDDFYYMDSALLADRLGPIRIETLRPTSDGFHTEWTGGTFDDVNDSTPNDATFLTGTTAGDRATFNFGNLQREAESVLFVDMLNRSSGTGNIETLVRSDGGTDATGGSSVLSGSFVERRVRMAENPVTVAAWTPANVNDYQLGVQVPS